MIKIALSLSALILLAGCMSEKERMLKEGYPPNFAIGYEDGCATGNSEAGAWASFKKNVRLYEADKDYRHGWDEGKTHCYNQFKSTQDIQLQQALERKLNEKKK